ncbi:hypothetical protein [Magnetovibrio blakemorei]|uniref:Uncharacterized protein n=1 Tax=Magnetovibrio blakemorei TaxID=28181 RepID=A0A1E5QAC9_9PROT|nr:hypothetical protein [Magnetovibrio blakemorei]OEJ68674.1 hypothetical protein BEN30_05520 [Magnetovibrio blakemorei]
MANLETLDFLRLQLSTEISYDLCMSCTDPQQKQIALNYDDPRNCGCRCPAVEPLLARLADIEKAIKISVAYLS